MKEKVYVTNPGHTIFELLTYGNYHLKGNKVEMGGDGSDPRSGSLNSKEEILSNAAKELLEMIFVAVKAGAKEDCCDEVYGYEEEIPKDSPLNKPTVDIVIDPEGEFKEGKIFNDQIITPFFGKNLFDEQIKITPVEAYNASLNGFQSTLIEEIDYENLVNICKEALQKHDPMEAENLLDELKKQIKIADFNDNELDDGEIPAFTAWIKFLYSGSSPKEPSTNGNL
jgi:hypothetical protein